MRKIFTRTGTIAVAAVAVTGVGVAFAAWTATGSGSGSATAVSAQPLTTTAVAAPASLYPGSPASSGILKLTVNNPNPYPVSVTSVAAGATPIIGTADCDGSNISWTAPATQSARFIAAGGSNTWDLTGVSMIENADNDCQGVVFTIPVTLAGASTGQQIQQ